MNPFVYEGKVVKYDFANNCTSETSCKCSWDADYCDCSENVSTCDCARIYANPKFTFKGSFVSPTIVCTGCGLDAEKSDSMNGGVYVWYFLESKHSEQCPYKYPYKNDNYFIRICPINSAAAAVVDAKNAARHAAYFACLKKFDEEFNNEIGDVE
jgi:hypothetical protein